MAGAESEPLISIDGVEMATIQARFLACCDYADPSAYYWGAAIGLEDLAIPLAAELTGASDNPVAQNLLSSGGDGGGDDNAVNPSFSLAVAGMSGPGKASPLNVELRSDTEIGDTIWVPAQRSFGPLQCRRLGLNWPDPNPDKRLCILFDGGVSLGALAIDLEGLSLGIPLSSPGQLDSYSLDLQGLALSLDTGAVAIEGALLEVPASGDVSIEYDGAATIAAASWQISALGSFAQYKGQASLFVFAQIGAELGGPPFFFVTGLCAGFGYNRSLRLPAPDEISDFPLLAGIADPSEIGGEDASPEEALAALDEWIAPAQGIDWIAAGVQFTSFELVQSNVVVTSTLSASPQIALLGVSRIKLAQTGPEFAYAELGLSVAIDPAAGYFGVSASLSPSSYLLTSDCHLTGGFAFWIWYSGVHSGDFVVTLGGYHPDFEKPDHYPDVPRLGFSWHVDDNLTIQGDSYFALTSVLRDGRR